MVGMPAPALLRPLVPGLVALITVFVFLPSLRNGFVNWDDLRMFVENPHYRGFGGAPLRWAWTTVRLGEYMPLTWMSYAADYVVWGLEPFGYHLTNLLLHTCAALVVYALSLRLLGTGSEAGDCVGIYLAAGVAALVFSIHPLRAEPVAWVSARGTILGGLLLLLCTWAYVTGCARSDGGPIPWPWLAGASGLFALSLLARSTGLVLPAALLVLDVYPLRRLGGGPRRWLGPAVRHVWQEKLPFVALALVVVPIALLARVESGDALRREHYEPVVSAAVALFGAAFYVKQTFLLGVFAPLYEMPSPLEPLGWPFLLSGALVLLITGFLVAARRQWPAGLAAWSCYMVLLTPMSGLVPFGLLHLAADRYTYVSCVGWGVLVGAGLLAGWRAWRRGRIGTSVAALASGLVLVALVSWSTAAWSQVQVWRDSKTLWVHTVAVSPRSAVAHNNLGVILESEGNLSESIEHYRRASQIWPSYAPFFINLGRALASDGKPSEAVEALRRSILLRPRAPDGYVALGVVLFSQGQVDEAVAQYRTALRLEPDSAVTHYKVGLALTRQGKVSEAVEHYRRALELRPDFAEARTKLDLALKQL